MFDHSFTPKPEPEHCYSCCQVCREQDNAERERYSRQQEEAMLARRREVMTRRCPSCGAEPGRRCLSASGARVKTPHVARKHGPVLALVP